jgi:hypothetical protein
MNFRNMNFRSLFFLTLGISVCLVAAAAEKTELKPVGKVPEGLSEKLAGMLNPAGYRVAGPKDQTIEFWLAKELAVKPDFKPTLNVKYPFTSGQLMGAIRIPEGSKYTDFRGQKMAPGVYTLRYGLQPLDGNHVGTSATSDFFLALPAKNDKDPQAITDSDELSSQSAKSVSATHPAIFSMLPPQEEADEPSLSHDEEHDFWIVSLTAAGKEGDKAVKLPLRFVVVGRALE